MLWTWLLLGQAQGLLCQLWDDAVQPMACSKVSVQSCICQHTEHHSCV